MFRANDDIQQGIISYLKGKSAITSQLKSSNDIKEDQWKGTVANYPMIRVRMISNVPSSECDASFTASIMVFSEEASSQEADHIAGIIANILLGRGFSSTGVAFVVWATNIIPAIGQEQTWRSEVLISGKAS